MAKMTVKTVNLKIKDLEEFKEKVKHVFQVAQETTTEEEYGFTCGRVLSMIDDEIIRLECLETTEEY